MCRAGGTPAGGEPQARPRPPLALGDPHRRPTAASTTSATPATPEFLPQHYRFPLGLPAATVRRLNQHARRLLDTHGCRHEPLTWSPATDSIPLDHLPGPDPDAIDPDRVQTPRPPRTASTPPAKLGITVEHLRYIARKHPSEIHDPAAATAPHRVRFAAVLGAAQLRELIDQGNSLRQIEASHGICRTHAPRRTHRPRHPRPAKNRHRSSQPGDSRRIVHLSPTTAARRDRRMSIYDQPHCPSSFDPFMG